VKPRVPSPTLGKIIEMVSAQKHKDWEGRVELTRDVNTFRNIESWQRDSN
jgi:hypothetical protein